MLQNNTTPAGAALSVSGFSKQFGRIAALVDVTFSIHPGEVLGLIGPNGAGKTTLFECVAGLLPAAAGRLTRGGQPVSHRDLQALLFYVPDAIAPWPTQPVRWALDYVIGFFGGRAGMRSELVDGLGLGALLDRPVGALSKGQRKRVLLAIGLLSAPPMVFIDEPFEGLDLRQTREVAAVLRAQAARGRTLFLSIHQIADAARVCDRFVLLSEGRVRGEGTIADLATIAAAKTGALDPGQAASLEEVFLALT
jgi:ABC-2 type transport system ATP-binding protein